ncbi:MAG: hypothetical protein OCD02_18015 [Spirochaetaceae bacterium]
MKIFKILTGQKRSLFRDPMTLFLTFIPFLIFGLVRFGLPILNTYIIEWVDLYHHYEFIMLTLYLVTPLLLGMVFGFLLMDERDLDVLTYISVTPVSLKGYIIIKTITGSVIGFLFNIILAILIKDKIDIRLIITLLLSSILVPYYALAIFTFSKNKVEGLTKGKLMGFTLFAAFVPYFTVTKLSFLLGIFPPFWLEKIYFALNIKELIIYTLFGLLSLFLSLSLLYRRIT